MSEQVVYRLQYQQPRREAYEPDTGYPGGDLVRDEEDEVEFGPTATRYYFTRRSLDRKISKLTDSQQGADDGVEPCPGRIIAVDVATLGPWESVES